LRDVSADYEGFRFNTMIAKLMELTNTLFRYRGTTVAGGPEWDETIRLLLLMLAPSAPHITEELWSRRASEAGEAWSSIHTEPWPAVDPGAVVESTREIPVQVNGKLRDKVIVPADATQADIEAAVLARDRIRTILDGKAPDASSSPRWQAVNLVADDATDVPIRLGALCGTVHSMARLLEAGRRPTGSSTPSGRGTISIIRAARRPIFEGR
jgi:leucyl-tRNA synthetase